MILLLSIVLPYSLTWNISWCKSFTFSFSWICRFYPHARMRTPTSMFHPLRSSFWFHLQPVRQLVGNSQKKTNPWWTTTYSQQWPRSLLVRVFVYIFTSALICNYNFLDDPPKYVESRAGWRFLRQRQWKWKSNRVWYQRTHIKWEFVCEGLLPTSFLSLCIKKAAAR